VRREADLIQFLQRRFPPRHGVRVGIGDDAAVLRGPAGGQTDWVVTTDLFIENVHFLPGAQPAGALGWKALARSLSDIAAMAARPRFALVSLAVPASTPARWVEEFFAGLARLARRYRVRLAGGDLSSAAQVVADVQVIGELARGRALLRSTARPGDRLFVSGTLGLAALGVRCLGRSSVPSGGWFARARRAHLYPQPRLRLAWQLAQRGARAMIDLSDGLSTDLTHLCAASDVGARLYTEHIPTVALGEKLEQRLHLSSLQLALHGGEDYELLFTVPTRVAARLPKRLAGVSLTQIGEITTGRGIFLVETDQRGGRRSRRLGPGGWDHFRRPRD
jgi:thiamine-monophosphate kinase